LAEQSSRLADEVDELLDRHGLVGDLTVSGGVAASGHRDGDDSGHVGPETVGALAQPDGFDECFVRLPVEPGA
jgi:hypothetical protein